MSHIVKSGMGLVESPRWHDGRVWFSDWTGGEILAVTPSGDSEVVLSMPSWPFCIDWLPDGRLLVVSSAERKLLRREHDGALLTHAELGGVADHPNDIAVDGRGNAYVGDLGFEYGSDFAPGTIAVVTPAGEVRQVAEGVAFPNGVVVTPDDSTLIVAESYAAKLTAFDIAGNGDLHGQRVWAGLGEGAAPDGICLAADGTVWYADVPNKCCVRVAEGGDVLQRVDLDRGCFSCALGGPGRGTLYITAAQWGGDDFAGTGQLVAAQV